MVANRACAPCSKLYCYEQWLREDVRIEGTATLDLHHLYRAMDLLEAHKDGIEQALYFRLADLLNLDVELIFYDTTSLHFEIDEMDQGHGEDDLVEGSMAAGSKVYKALRKRGMSKNGRSDAPQIVIGLAVTRDGLPVRHWVFPGNTVDGTTVAQGSDDLKGWKLSRCGFVGDAGMVSQDNLDRLSKSGGKYIVCMPRRRGDEVTHDVLQRPGRLQQVADNWRVKEVVGGKANAVVAMSGATIPKRTNANGLTADRSCVNSRPSWRLSKKSRVRATASGWVSCGPVVAMVALCA